MADFADLFADQALRRVVAGYRDSFNSKKTYGEENNESDPLMDLFGITPELKRENPQYWGREMGKCWERLMVALCSASPCGCNPGHREGRDELSDLVVGRDAIDTKYRIGSGDSGTLGKFRQYGETLRQRGFNPIMLVLRPDSLPAAVGACEAGGWTVMAGSQGFGYIERLTGTDLLSWLAGFGTEFRIDPLQRRPHIP